MAVESVISIWKDGTRTQDSAMKGGGTFPLLRANSPGGGPREAASLVPRKEGSLSKEYSTDQVKGERNLSARWEPTVIT